MNNIYVDELPKSCENCPFYKLDTYIDINYVTRTSHECVLEGSILTGDCPLKSLTNRLAEERKKVVQEIRQDLANKLTYNINDLENIMVICNKINSVLDKFERGE